MSSVLRGTARSATEIARELTREFESALYQRTGVEPEPDPILATVFHALAVQVAHVYEEAETAFPATVLDDLINVLGITPRLARPAQTIVSFNGADERERITPWVELRGYNKSGEQIGFSPDDSIELSDAHLLFAGLYENGRLHAIRGGRTSPDGPPVPSGSVPLSLGQRPATLYLALDADPGHLSGLGLYLDAQPFGGPVIKAVQGSPWQMLSDGAVVEAGVLRSVPGPGGMRRLHLSTVGVAVESEAANSQAAESGGMAPTASPGGAGLDGGDGKDSTPHSQHRGGIFGGQVFVFPPIPEAVRFRSTTPDAIADAVRRLLPPERPDALDRPLIWIQIPLPTDVQEVAPSLHRVELHCVSASNVEVFNERLAFGRSGGVVSLEPEGKRNRHLMGVVSVVGESGTPYVEESDIHAPVAMGRYRHRARRLEMRPGTTKTGRPDAYAMVRLLYCDGDAANGLEPGDLKQISTSLRNVTAQVKNLTVTRGGGPPPEYTEARLRFADQIKSRERVVTAADVESAVRSFEPRVGGVRVSSGPQVTAEGTRRVERVSVQISAADFADPESETARLGRALRDHLQGRAVLGTLFQVEVDLV